MIDAADEDNEDKPKPTFKPPAFGTFKAPSEAGDPEPDDAKREPEEIKYFDAKDYDKVLPKALVN